MLRPLRAWAWILLGSCASLLAAGVAQGQTDQAAGRFLSVAGEVRLVDQGGRSRPAERTSEMRQGDRIVTGGSGLAQLRMADGALLSVRPNSDVRLDLFVFSEQERSGSASQFAISIIQGGFRTITGLIASRNRAGYRVSTPMATIGVRGTDYEVVHLPRQVAEARPGTYNRVYDGVVSLQNAAGGAALLINRDQTAFVAARGVAPVLVAPPGAVFGRGPTPLPPGPRSSEQDKGGPKDAGGDVARPDGAPAPSRATTAAPVDSGRATITPLDSPRTLTTPLDAPRTLTTPLDSPRTLTTPLDSPRTVTTPTLSTPLESPRTVTTPTLTTPLESPRTVTTPTLSTPAGVAEDGYYTDAHRAGHRSADPDRSCDSDCSCDPDRSYDPDCSCDSDRACNPDRARNPDRACDSDRSYDPEDNDSPTKIAADEGVSLCVRPFF